MRAETGTGSVERTLTFHDQSEVELHVSSIAHPKPLRANKPVSSAKNTSDLKVPAMFREP